MSNDSWFSKQAGGLFRGGQWNGQKNCGNKGACNVIISLAW
jgi:hypothetical protein